MKDEYAVVNNVEIHYHEYPNEGAESIIFLHYGGGNLAMWGGMIPNFTDKFQVIVPELRGHGYSSQPKKGYHVDDMAKDITGLMDYIGIEKAYIVGSSLGAGVAISLAANFPDKVMALCCEGAFNNDFGPYGKYDFSTDEEIDAYKDEWRQKISEEPPRRVFDSLEQRIENNREFHEQQGWPFNEHTIKEIEYCSIEQPDGTIADLYNGSSLLEITEVYWELKFEDYHSRIQCPVVFFPGEEDMKNSRIRNAIAYFQSLLPYCKVVEIEGAEHAYIAYGQPEEYTQEIVSFIEDQ